MRALFVVALLCSSAAVAYPWMLRHDLTGCASCHVDPSGAGQLTPFGRLESEQLVRWTPTPSPDPMRNASFLWFLQLPAEVNLSGNLRFGALIAPGAPRTVTPLEMAADLAATFTLAEKLVLHGTGGFGRRDAIAAAAVAPHCEPSSPGECGPSFVARTYWAGAKATDAIFVRGGRIPVPFGLRTNEHSTWVRALTLTDTNVQQRLGVSASYSGAQLRAEVMGIASTTLADTNESGYSAFAEYSFTTRTTLGVSSLVAGRPQLGPTARQAHGAFFRWAPVQPLVLLAEADVLAWTTPGVADRVGYATLVQGDWEPIQGVHVMLTAESAHDGRQRGPSFGAWLSAAWYFFSHFELRLDNVLRRIDATQPLSYALVLQLHVFL